MGKKSLEELLKEQEDLPVDSVEETAYPSVKFEKSVAKGGEQRPEEFPEIEFKGDRDGNVNKKEPIDPEDYDEEEPNFDDEVVDDMKKDKRVEKGEKPSDDEMKKLTKEEIEYLDELSKKTLVNYLKKSSQDAAHQSERAAKARQAHQELANAEYANRTQTSPGTERRHNRSVFDHPEVKDAVRKNAQAIEKDAERRLENRRFGQSRAIKRLTKEDIDQESISKIENLFSGEELSEEFVSKVKDIFESAVLETAQSVLEESYVALEEDFNDKLEIALDVCEEEVENYKVELDEKADAYFDYVVERWVEENRPVLHTNIKTELTESFINGLKNLFVEHYIDIPEEKVDVVEELVSAMESLEMEKEEILQENLSLRNQQKEVVKDLLIREHAKDLSESEQEKFFALAENLNFDNEENFVEKLNSITEAYFGDDLITESTIEDDIPLETLEEEVNVHIEEKTEVQKMAETMAKFFKK